MFRNRTIGAIVALLPRLVLLQKHGHLDTFAEGVTRHGYPGHAQGVQVRWSGLRDLFHHAGCSHLHTLLLHPRKYNQK